MAVPVPCLSRMLTAYKKGLQEASLEYVIFGHIGDGHLHVNVLPKNNAEMLSAYDIYIRFAHEIICCHGSVSAEHGIGRIKKELLTIQYDFQVLERMKYIKKIVDPFCVLNPGVLFDV